MRLFPIVLVLLAACGDDVEGPDLAANPHDLSVGDMAMSACTNFKDVATQSCPMGQKCTIVGDVSNPMAAAFQCVAVTGSKMDGDSCTPPGGLDAGTVTGADDCAKGLICTARPEGAFCHKVCDQDSMCGTQFCSQFAYCDFQCAFKGTDCPAGFGCEGIALGYDGASHLVCIPYGTKALGEACTSTGECAQNTVCAGTTKQCRDICNDAHSCVTGTCMGLPGSTGGTTTLGFCQ